MYTWAHGSLRTGVLRHLAASSLVLPLIWLLCGEGFTAISLLVTKEIALCHDDSYACM